MSVELQFIKELLSSVKKDVAAALKGHKPNLRQSIGVLRPRQLPRTNPEAGGSTSTPGFVQFAPDGGVEPLTAVQGSDSRLLAADDLADHESGHLYKGVLLADLDPAVQPDGTTYYIATPERDDRGHLTAISGMPFGWLARRSLMLRAIDGGELYSTRLEQVSG